MQNNQTSNSLVYSKEVIEFVTVAVETCLFLERTEELSNKQFIEQAVKILPLLYFKTVLLKQPEPILDDAPERFVTEEDYQYVNEKIEQVLGTENVFLEVFSEEMQYSDTPVTAFISENLADIYQEIKDFAMRYRIGVEDLMNDALVLCLDSFAEHWGQKLLNSLRALHALRYAEELDKTEDLASQMDRNSFLGFLREEEDESASIL